MMIDLIQPRTFVAVAEELHLTRAAERLHISQPAASTHVRAVEENLDTQRFVRTNARPSSGARQGLKSGELDVAVLLGRPVDAGFSYH